MSAWAAVWIGTLAATAITFAARFLAHAPFYDYANTLGIAAVALSTLGAVVLRSRPRHRFGRFLLAVGASWAVPNVFGQGALVLGTSSPAAPWLALGAQMLRPAIFAATILLVAVYPDGRLPSPRWRVVPALAVSAFLVLVPLAGLLAPGPLDEVKQFANPVHAAWQSTRLVRVLEAAANPIILGMFVLTFASLVVRYRRRGPTERKQIQWLGLSVLACVVVIVVADTIFPDDDAHRTLFGIVWTTPVVLPPAAMAVAIVRHNLWEIERLVSRGVSYGVVTAALAAVYAGVALVLGTVVRGSSVAVAAATLAVAALFRPLRGRVQLVVDRRFNRTRYDAIQMTEAFASRLRDGVELGILASLLESVADETMQPSRVSLWIRP